MQLNAVVDSRILAIKVADGMLHEAEGFFARMDHDMDHGWQMGPEFIESPDRIQRCQIAANKLLVSLSAANETLATLMAAYILSRLPGVTTVHIDTGGEMQNTRFEIDSPAPVTAPPPASVTPSGAAEPEKRRHAMARAGREVAAVFRAGRGWRFAVLDPASGHWQESAVFGSEVEAQDERLKAVKARYDRIVASARALN